MLCVQYNVFPYQKKGEMEYGETPAYGHLSSTVTSLLGSFFFGCLTKTTIHFLVKKTSLIWPNFFGLLVTVLSGFHCTLFKVCIKRITCISILGNF